MNWPVADQIVNAVWESLCFRRYMRFDAQIHLLSGICSLSRFYSIEIASCLREHLA